MNSHEIFIHIHQGCFAGTGAIVRLPQCQWSKLDGYGKISQCITTTKHSKAKTACIFLGIYCITLDNADPDLSSHRASLRYNDFVNRCNSCITTQNKNPTNTWAYLVKYFVRNPSKMKHPVPIDVVLLCLFPVYYARWIWITLL